MPWAAAALVALLLVACDSAEPERDGSSDSTGEDASEAAAPDGEASAPDVDVDRPVEAGPLTFVVGVIEMLTDRLCDLDGDGVEDNAVADLGSPHSEIFRLMVNAAIDEARGAETGRRYLLHAPTVSDLGGPTEPSLCIITLIGEAMDESDESEPVTYWRDGSFMDDCGEPEYAARDVVLDRGALSGTVSAFPVSFAGSRFVMTDAIADGTIDGAEGTLELRLCGAATFATLGGISGMTSAGDLTLLELFLAGGAALGTPTAPGLEPDLDLDGDGVERFVADDVGQIVRCIDGDATAIEGRDCWRDERMADGFSLNLVVNGSRAILGEFLPAVQARIETDCPSPPAESAWDGC